MVKIKLQHVCCSLKTGGFFSVEICERQETHILPEYRGEEDNDVYTKPVDRTETEERAAQYGEFKTA